MGGINIQSETSIKQFEDLTLKVKDFAKSIVETIHEPFMVLNKDKKVMYANTSFYDYFKVTPDETIGNVIYDIGKRVNARIIDVQGIPEHIILTAIEDITYIRKKENELKEHVAELEKANAELERFNKVFVGRELRMIELKKIITELEEDVLSLKKTDILGT